MKLKVTVTKTEQIEKEIQFPYYFKLTERFIPEKQIALLDEERGIVVCADGGVYCGKPQNIFIIYSAHTGTMVEITESEFKQAFETCMEKIVATLPENF